MLVTAATPRHCFVGAAALSSQLNCESGFKPGDPALLTQ